MSKSKPIADTLNKYLQDPEEASAYLDAVLESGDSGALLVALRDVVDARGGVSELALAQNLNRETLYRTLAEGCLLYTSPSPRDKRHSLMRSSA